MNCCLSHMLLAFRSNELAVVDRAALEGHLAICPACAALARVTVATDNAFRKAMLAVPIPEGLRSKLHSSVSAQQRTELWRKARLWGWAGLAASVVATLGTWAVIANKPQFSPGIASDWLENERLTREQSVNAWLASEGLPNELPLPFEYGHHAAHAVGPLGDMKVPFVLFQNERGQCRVYILKKDSVQNPTGNWKDVFGSEYNIKVVDPHNGYVYLIAISTSATLDAFLKPLPPVA